MSSSPESLKSVSTADAGGRRPEGRAPHTWTRPGTRPTRAPCRAPAGQPGRAVRQRGGQESHPSPPPFPGNVLEASRSRDGFPGGSGVVGLLNQLIQKRNRKCAWRLSLGPRERVREPPVLAPAPFLTLRCLRGSWHRARSSGRATRRSQGPSPARGACDAPITCPPGRLSLSTTADSASRTKGLCGTRRPASVCPCPPARASTRADGARPCSQPTQWPAQRLSTRLRGMFCQRNEGMNE